MTIQDETGRPGAEISTVQKVSAILWPSFLFAGAANSIFFTFMDPFRLFACTGTAPLSRIGAYSVGFLLFWLLCIGSSLGTAYFMKRIARVSRRSRSTGSEQG